MKSADALDSLDAAAGARMRQAQLLGAALPGMHESGRFARVVVPLDARHTAAKRVGVGRSEGDEPALAAFRERWNDGCMTRMPPTPRLETERMWLEPLCAQDAPAIQRRFSRWEIVRHLAVRVPWPYPADGAELFVRSTLRQVQAGSKNVWTLRLKDRPSELIGCIELWPPDPVSRDSRGFWLDPDFQRRGLMTEAADRVVEYAFDALGWPFLWLGNAKSNVASARVKQRQGAVLIEEVPFEFVSGEEMRQVWRLDPAGWRARPRRP